MDRYRNAFDLDALSVSISDLLVATSEGADAAIESAVPAILRRMRDDMGMDVVFVSEFVGGQRVFRFVDSTPDAPALPVDSAGPLEASYCQRVVDGRLPEFIQDVGALPAGTDLPHTAFKVGAHLSTPVVLSDGKLYGTVCCFSLHPDGRLRQHDLQCLKQCAQLVARKVEIARNNGRAQRTWQDSDLHPVG